MFNEIFTYDFLKIAFFASLLSGFAAGIISPLIVYKKMEFIGDGTAHAAFAGLAIGLFFDVDYRVVAILTAILFSLLISFFSNKHKIHENSAIGMLLPVFMSVGVIIISKSSTYVQDLTSYLFGDILLVKLSDVWFLIFVILSSIVIISLMRYEILFFLADEEMAAFYGVNIKQIRTIFLILISVIVVSIVKISGIILLGALIIIPGLFAKKLAKSFSSVFVFSIFYNLVVTFLGFYLSYYFDISPGPVIVLTSFTIFIIFSFLKKQNNL
ncbi:metal ABC transporter permease [Thermosipho atlanticus]|uniref:Zinc transport system permease protein n=1 Tax=Thermosipho atlanticus DSM 15807 TaxID=1123380 RepID=A0A1M5T0G6_9BACT|nr:metal ABC transporter permease [Thermosipho atlanticus]SHH43863.1 zinc transport system permease protein [Thermosipho atlanticus DSM 15807]